MSVNEPPRKPGADAESLLGGADTVEKTTWVLWAIVLIAAFVALVYVLGVVR